MKNLYYRLLNFLLLPILKREIPLKQVNERIVEHLFALEMINKYCTGNILEVGPGRSSFAHLLYSCGYDVTAIDKKDTRFFRYMFFNRHFKVINADITKGIKGSFQFINCISVLEHIQDSYKALLGMVEATESNGYILLTFPYSESHRCSDVYMGNENFITQIYNAADVDMWIRHLGLIEVERKYYQVFTGKYWNDGIRIKSVETPDANKRQLICLLLKKN